MLSNKTIHSFVLFLLLLLLTQCDSKNQIEKKQFVTDTTSFYTQFSTDTLEKEYGFVLDSIWENYVPLSGQSSTVQGELVRIINKLDHEIRGNGKGNWEDPQFKILITYLKDTLTKSGIFPSEISKEIVIDIDILADDETAVTEDFYYDRLRRRIVEWCLRHPVAIKHTRNINLNR